MLINPFMVSPMNRTRTKIKPLIIVRSITDLFPSFLTSSLTLYTTPAALFNNLCLCHFSIGLAATQKLTYQDRIPKHITFCFAADSKKIFFLLCVVNGNELILKFLACVKVRARIMRHLWLRNMILMA